jgi:hypothetical protein
MVPYRCKSHIHSSSVSKINLTYSMEQRPSSEADSRSAGQEISKNFMKPEVKLLCS